MADAPRDNNNVPCLIAALNSNGSTIVRVQVDSSSHGLRISNGTSGSDHGPTDALKDSNMVSTLLAVSSSDGQTPVVVYSDSSGNLLVKST